MSTTNRPTGSFTVWCKKYHLHRNAYNSAVRRSKANFYETNLALYSKNSRKTWQLLKEASGLNTTPSSVSEPNINGTSTTDSTEVANAFKEFFSTAGTNIANSIPLTTADPLSYCTTFPNLCNLDLAGVGPVLVGDTIKHMVSKSSTDLDDISFKLLKNVRFEIEAPLTHVFNLSFFRWIPAQV